MAEDGDGAAEVIDVEVNLEEHSTKAVMVQRGEQRGADVNIEDADILVAGGRGLGKAEGFEQCEALAEAHARPGAHVQRTTCELSSDPTICTSPVSRSTTASSRPNMSRKSGGVRLISCMIQRFLAAA